MSAACPNCGALLTCGCQKRTTSDGKNACGTCIQAYEQQLQQQKLMTQQAINNITPGQIDIYINS